MALPPPERAAVAPHAARRSSGGAGHQPAVCQFCHSTAAAPAAAWPPAPGRHRHSVLPPCHHCPCLYAPSTFPKPLSVCSSSSSLSSSVSEGMPMSSPCTARPARPARAAADAGQGPARRRRHRGRAARCGRAPQPLRPFVARCIAKMQASTHLGQHHILQIEIAKGEAARLPAHNQAAGRGGQRRVCTRASNRAATHAMASGGGGQRRQRCCDRAHQVAGVASSRR